MEDRTPRPYASSDEDFEMVPDANGTSNAKDTLTLTAAAELSHISPTDARATVALAHAGATWLSSAAAVSMRVSLAPLASGTISKSSSELA